MESVQDSKLTLS